MATFDRYSNWSWLQTYQCAAEPVYCETAHRPDDVLYSGSEDEYYDSPTQRKLRYEDQATQFLEGRVPFLQSASLRGPFGQAASWCNPWRGRGGRVAGKSISSHGVPATTDVPDADVEVNTELSGAQATFAPETLSFSDDVQSSGPLSHDSETTVAIAQATLEPHDHPYLDATVIARVHDWRNGVKISTAARDSFWTGSARGHGRTTKRKAGASWLRRDIIKRRKSGNTDADVVDSPTPAHIIQPPDSTQPDPRPPTTQSHASSQISGRMQSLPLIQTRRDLSRKSGQYRNSPRNSAGSNTRSSSARPVLPQRQEENPRRKAKLLKAPRSASPMPHSTYDTDVEADMESDGGRDSPEAETFESQRDDSFLFRTRARPKSNQEPDISKQSAVRALGAAGLVSAARSSPEESSSATYTQDEAQEASPQPLVPSTDRDAVPGGSLSNHDEQTDVCPSDPPALYAQIKAISRDEAVANQTSSSPSRVPEGGEASKLNIVPPVDETMNETTLVNTQPENPAVALRYEDIKALLGNQVSKARAKTCSSSSSSSISELLTAPEQIVQFDEIECDQSDAASSVMGSITVAPAIQDPEAISDGDQASAAEVSLTGIANDPDSDMHSPQGSASARLDTQRQSPWAKVSEMAILKDVAESRTTSAEPDPQMASHGFGLGQGSSIQESSNIAGHNLQFPEPEQLPDAPITSKPSPTEVYAENPWAAHKVLQLSSPKSPSGAMKVHRPSPLSILPQGQAMGSRLDANYQDEVQVRPSTPDTKPSSLPTPDFTLSIKSFRHFMSPSPLQNRSSQRSGRVSEGTILSNPWTNVSARKSRLERRVRFAPLPGEVDNGGSDGGLPSSPGLQIVDEDDYIESGLKRQPRRRVVPPAPSTFPRTGSPPPLASLADLPCEVDKFQEHYAAMATRGPLSKPRTQGRLLPSLSQQDAPSPAVGALADRFLAVDQELAGPDISSPALKVRMTDSHAVEDTDLQVDDVGAVLQNLGDFLTTFDVDAEVEHARVSSACDDQTRQMMGIGLEMGS
ncbi:uncharacterized protein E0L32_009696 [Thyridium curvatum]|uniref:Protamine P1 n=1 Tax=Thyridium curvatum TaxID=1093900 RepID=A0A507AVK6_9PEZI|nr:uncharacterized protein E0L32_009696 [Thyridium curvatum]TPX08878.1 hypothetical protein E0L32_009696 [Thyridium curvatum]